MAAGRASVKDWSASSKHRPTTAVGWPLGSPCVVVVVFLAMIGSAASRRAGLMLFPSRPPASRPPLVDTEQRVAQTPTVDGAQPWSLSLKTG